MKNLIVKSFAILALGSFTAAHAADSANQLLNFQVKPFVDIQVADRSLDLVITSIPLSGKGEARAKSSYSIVNNKLGQKITASLDKDMPNATELTLEAEAPSGASSADSVKLSSKAVDVATKVDRVNQSGIQLEYLFAATEQASTDAFVRTVTYTVISM